MPHVHASVSVTTEPTTADVLRDVRDLLADPARWIKGWYARIDRESLDMSRAGTSEDVTCFCVRGALQRVLNNCETETEHPAFVVLRDVIPEGFKSVASFNDAPSTRHVDILDALDRAVSAAVLAETK